jgi:serine/threonine protein kinase
MQGLSAGQVIANRFTLVRRLGRGGVGDVWLADDGDLGERVALKLLDSGIVDQPGAEQTGPRQSAPIDLLRRECSRARALVHPNIVRVYDFHSADDSHFISMQFVDGETLVAERGVDFRRIVSRALMVCDALAYAHRAGVIHRDIKPGNVLVDANGVCYLTDFGIAALTSGESAQDIRGGGSLPYMSPQQLAGEPPSVADDVYCLGALIFDLLSGAPLLPRRGTKTRAQPFGR